MLKEPREVTIIRQEDDTLGVEIHATYADQVLRKTHLFKPLEYRWSTCEFVYTISGCSHPAGVFLWKGFFKKYNIKVTLRVTIRYQFSSELVCCPQPQGGGLVYQCAIYYDVIIVIHKD